MERGEGMYVDADAIIRTAAVLGAISAIFACLYKLFKWVDNQQEQDKKMEELKLQHEKDIKLIQDEQCVMCWALLATLDGLIQQGANGDVTKAYKRLEKHLNQKAHGQEEG